ncbi:unnamed protein product [Paramecium sonneborni]|uniref:Protein kinase domain-containing protein n=1 Tax=Paramecium sonneborni TaxID=65129 RepID=A0A8S1PUJ3_9CILI|nr:unnamed protein product [Paramecium sonneborni]
MIDNYLYGSGSTASHTNLQSQKIQIIQKIIGYNPKLDKSKLNLIPLRNILPVSIKQLDFILTNLIQIILETIKRDLETPDISLDQIMVIEQNHECGIPFIFSKEDNTTARQCEDKLCNQFQVLCEQLGFDEEFANSISLQQFQDRLLLKINFQQDALEENSDTLLQLLQITKSQPIFNNENTYLYPIQPPSFILKNLNEDEIVVKISKILDEEFYDLREISIIEEFNNKHLPHLYGYLRYSDIIILFMKKHDCTFNWIATELFKKRKELKSEQIEQIIYKTYGSMIHALSYIHSIDLIHRDLKPENIMFDLFQNTEDIAELQQIPFNCVLIDFDRSILVDNVHSKKKSQYKGTPFYRPPEGIQDKYHSSYDIWQLGFMWFLISKQFFYRKNIQKSSDKQLYDNICIMKTKTFEFNQKIIDLQEQLQSIDTRRIDDKQKEKEKKTLQTNIQIQFDQRKQLYNHYIQLIDDQENFITYKIQLQNLIKKMIDLEPKNRATIYEIQAVFNTLID